MPSRPACSPGRTNGPAQMKVKDDKERVRADSTQLLMCVICDDDRPHTFNENDENIVRSKLIF